MGLHIPRSKIDAWGRRREGWETRGEGVGELTGKTTIILQGILMNIKERNEAWALLVV